MDRHRGVTALRLYLFSPLGKRVATAFVCGVCIGLLNPAVLCGKGNPLDTILPYLDNGGYALQVSGTIVYGSNVDSRFIPASTIKIFTGLMALETLGPEFRFTTQFYRDNDANLYIKGSGDPLLTSESIAEIATRLQDLGIQRLKSIVLDDTAFALEGPPPGSKNSANPYDAGNGALAVNFNSLPFTVTSNNKVVSGEPQTPAIPLMHEIGSRYGKGSYRVNVSSFAARRNHSNILRYCGELFTSIFQHHGITVENGFRSGEVPPHANRLFTHASATPLRRLVQLCLRYSNNYIANQLYLACGRKIHGGPATWQKANTAARRYISRRLKLSAEAIRLVDGSGLAVANAITPGAMLIVLERFRPYADLLSQHRGIFLKSGTLQGVYGYAGYFGTDPDLAPFALLLNQQRNTRSIILQRLQEAFNTLTVPHRKP
ncbi:MAG: D-alanyl-D-alanine carboxypeptidase/D-alanyl-D-alanine-endopeptidase [Desulfopila sp.]